MSARSSLNDIGRFAVMKHLAKLEAAGLVIAERSGRERLLWFDPTPIQWIHERWTTELSAYWAARLTQAQVPRRGRGSDPSTDFHHERTPTWLTRRFPPTHSFASSSMPTSTAYGAS